MKKTLLLLVALNLVFGYMVSKAQDCINYELGQEGIGTLSETFGVSLADFDGDGWLDVVTVDAYDDIEVYFNDGAGLIDTNAYTLGANRWRFGVQVIDIENDGDWDFVTAPFSSNVSTRWLPIKEAPPVTNTSRLCHCISYLLGI